MMDESKYKLVRANQLTAAVLILLLIVIHSGPWDIWRTVGLVIAVPSLF